MFLSTQGLEQSESLTGRGWESLAHQLEKGGRLHHTRAQAGRDRAGADVAGDRFAAVAVAGSIQAEHAPRPGARDCQIGRAHV